MQTSPLPSTTRLAPFMGFAALLHAAAILVLPFTMHPSLPAPALRLALARPETAPAASATRTPPAAPVRPTHAAAVPIAEGAAPQPPAAPAASTESAALAGESSARVIAQVRSALTRYFVYPLAARRQGWQGEVLIGFSVTREGRIDNVEVVRSSGYRLLDEAARASLARVGQLPEYAAQGGEPLQLRMPVVYRLES